MTYLIESSYFDIVQLAVLNGRFCHQGIEEQEERMKRNIPEGICSRLEGDCEAIVSRGNTVQQANALCIGQRRGKHLVRSKMIRI